MLAIFESGEETEYAVISDGETSILCYEGMEELVFGLDEDSIHAFYEVTINEPKEKDSVFLKYNGCRDSEDKGKTDRVYLDIELVAPVGQGSVRPVFCRLLGHDALL